MPTWKLTYFDFPSSRGEECRLALHAAGIEFQDNRVKGPDWPDLKPTTPFGALPILEVEGQGTLSQSNAILTYIGRERGLHPENSWQAAQHEQLMCAVEDLRQKVWQILSISGDSERKRAREEMAAGLLKDWGRSVENLLGDGPFVAGDKLHVADIKLHMIVRWFASGIVDHVPTDVFAEFPKLCRVHEAVDSHAAVVDWRSR